MYGGKYTEVARYERYKCVSGMFFFNDFFTAGIFTERDTLKFEAENEGIEGIWLRYVDVTNSQNLHLTTW